MILSLLWDSLKQESKKDQERRHYTEETRKTGWGVKSKTGLIDSMETIFAANDPELNQEQIPGFDQVEVTL